MNGALVRKALINGNPVDQIISSSCSPYQTLTFNEVIYDTCDFWDQSENAFVIPWGVNFVRISGQAVFMTNGNGFRQLLVQRKSLGDMKYDFFPCSPIMNGQAVASTTTDLSFSSVVLPVVQGQRFVLQPYQNSGGDVAISGGTGTFFSIEAIT